jgi:hypothetical protein
MDGTATGPCGIMDERGIAGVSGTGRTKAVLTVAVAAVTIAPLDTFSADIAPVASIWSYVGA